MGLREDDYILCNSLLAYLKIKCTFSYSAEFSSWDRSKQFTFNPLANLFLYTSPPGRHVPLHFTPWQTCSFTLHPLVDMFLYTSPPGRPVPLHFTPRQTCSFTLHPLADLFLYTSLPGRPVPLHFTPGRPVPLHFTPW